MNALLDMEKETKQTLEQLQNQMTRMTEAERLKDAEKRGHDAEMALEELKHEEEKAEQAARTYRGSHQGEKAKLDQAQIAKQDAEKKRKRPKRKAGCMREEQTELGNTKGKWPAQNLLKRSGREKENLEEERQRLANSGKTLESALKKRGRITKKAAKRLKKR